MTIDVRAQVESSYGPVISASFSDDYIQGNGLIKTSGNCLVKGLVNPPIGGRIIFRYTKGGITRPIPRSLRVLSFFADPFRKTTSMQLGCKLTYLQDLKDPINWTAFDGDEENDFVEDDKKIVLVPITATSVMNKCLQELGLEAASVPLTNKFSVEKFDLSGGYIQVLSDLLVSENYCGYLDQDEKLRIINLGQSGGTGTVLSENDIIDVGEIGVGQLPGDSVVVSYSTLKLKLPDGSELDKDDPANEPFEGVLTSTTVSSGADVVVVYQRRDQEGSPTYTRVYNGSSSSTEETTYFVKTVLKSGVESGASDYLLVKTPGLFRLPTEDEIEEVSLVSRRVVRQTEPSAQVLGGYMNDLLSIGQSPPIYPSVDKETTETFKYDKYGNEIFRETYSEGSFYYLAGSAGISYVYEETTTLPNGSTRTEYNWVVLTPASVPLEKIEVFTEVSDGFTKITTNRYAPWFESIPGQQTIAAAREYIDTAYDAVKILNAIQVKGLSLVNTTVETRQSPPSPQRGPVSTQVVADRLADGDSANGYSTQSTALIELALGDPSAQRRIEFSLPYAPDDSFQKVGETYISRASDAPAKAKAYGITQNRMLLGNRNGINIQTVPEKLPQQPFSPFFVVVNGNATMYMTNGMSWTVDSSGIIASVDALYWGVAGTV